MKNIRPQLAAAATFRKAPELIMAFVASGEKTHWYKGMQLLTGYLIFSIFFFLNPGDKG